MTLHRFIRVLLGLVCCAGLCVPAARAADQGTVPGAEAMVKRAVASIEGNAADTADDAITNGKPFKDRDLLVVVADLDGASLARGDHPKLLGKDPLGMKVPHGKPLIRMFVDLAKDKEKDKGKGSIEGNAMDPERVGDMLVGCGIDKA